MAELRPEQYDALERAIIDGRRISVRRRGTEYIVVPTAIGVQSGRETLEALHPTTGEHLTLALEDLEQIEVV